ncbi:MAG: TRAP transporter small permease [Synergistaceae bacterium]|nr:TRAP transporter small permease [Synergistaceae bacterium]
MWKKQLERFLGWTSSLCFVGLVLVVLLQVFARTSLWPYAPPHWTEEASRFLMLYMVAFSAGLAAKERAYVNVDVFVNLLSGRSRAFMQLLIDILVIVLMGATAWYGWQSAAVGRIQTSASLGIPMHLIYGSMVLHAGSALLYTVALVFEDFKALVTGEVNYGNTAVS